MEVSENEASFYEPRSRWELAVVVFDSDEQVVAVLQAGATPPNVRLDGPQVETFVGSGAYGATRSAGIGPAGQYTVVWMFASDGPQPIVARLASTAPADIVARSSGTGAWLRVDRDFEDDTYLGVDLAGTGAEITLSGVEELVAGSRMFAVFRTSGLGVGDVGFSGPEPEQRPSSESELFVVDGPPGSYSFSVRNAVLVDPGDIVLVAADVTLPSFD